MTNIAKFERPIQWQNLRANEAEKIIRDAAIRDDGSIFIGFHSEEREEERDAIHTPQILDILKRGYVLEQPELNEDGEWVAKVEKGYQGGRDAVVVVEIACKGEELFVITVYWKDFK